MAGFEFDGCTGFPDRIGDADLTACCYAHDVAYWVQDVSKWDADLALYQCVAETIGGVWGDAIAAIMLLGVGTIGLAFWRRGRRGNRTDLKNGGGR